MIKNIYLLFSFSLFIFFSSSTQAADYFWVGGSGNWSDISHWATSSGGAVTYPVVPSPNDRVIFDENSFDGPNQSVSVLVDNIFCMDMDWSAVTNNPSFDIPANARLHVHGSLTLNPNMTWNHAGDLLFRATAIGQTIATANHPLAYSAYFSGQGGAWTLQDDFSVDSLIFLEEGSLDLGNSQVNTRYLDGSEATTTFNLDMNSAYITITGTTFITTDFQVESYPPLKLRGDRNNFTSGSATIELTQPNAEIWSSGGATINLPKLFFSAASGTAYLGAKDVFGNEESSDNLNLSNLMFASNGLIRSEGNIDTLSLSPGKSYNLNAGNTYTIQNIEASGTCIAPITLSSTDGNVPVNIVLSNGNITVDYLNLRGINASGGATFTNNEGADLGSNSGWTFNTTAAMDLFWVGGDGDWNDIANWSFTSGGPGGACLPNGNTDVFFDGNSFNAPNQVVNVNVDQISCLNMDWTGVSNSPTLQSVNSTVLSVFGSLTLDQSVTWNHLGTTQFLGNQTGNTITMAGQQMQGNIEFDGAGGEWILQDSFSVLNNIYLNNGHLNSNNQYIEISSFFSETENARRLSLGSSTFSLRAGQENRFEASTNNLVIDAGTSHIIANNGNSYFEFTQENEVNLYHVTTRGFTNFYSPRENQSNLIIQRLTALQDAIFTRLRADTLILTPTHRYQVYQEDTLSVGNIEANAGCSDYILLSTDYPFTTNYLTSENDQTLTRVIVENIHIVGAGTWTANQSTNLGNTDGWIFPDNEERTLFWVGDGGDWADPNNWSLSSGGPGGECIPTPNDDVIFDENSFTTPNATVFSSHANNFFKDMDWRDVTNSPNFQASTSNCYGSLYLSPNMSSGNLGYLKLAGNGDHEFAPHDFTWPVTEFNSTGIYRFLTDFRQELGSRMIIRSAEIFTNGFDWTIGELLIESPNENSIHTYHFEDSKIEITGSPFNQPSLNINFEVIATITPNTAEFEISGTDLSVQIDGIFPINRLFFSATDGTNDLRTSFNNIDIGRFGSIIFNSSADLEGPIATDSLILAAGKVFRFSNNFTMMVNSYLQALGNNCLPISIQSRSPGFQATIEMPASAIVTADFLQLQDHNGTGGANFFAGDFSTDIGNNSGWTFGTPSPDTQNGFLGSDFYFCEGDTGVDLNANFNTAGETYLWQDGSTQASFVAPDPGVYFAEVTFPAAANCVIRDTIEVLSVPDFAIPLPGDSTLCDSESLLLDVTSTIVGTQYLWQDSSQTGTFLVDSAGVYKVEISFENCSIQDSINIIYQAQPMVDLGADVLLCADEDITLNANITADNFLWSDGSTGSSLFVDQAGTYWVEASNDRCSDRDSIVVSYANEITNFLGPDQDLCQGTSLVLRSNLLGATYVWQDGSTLDSLVVTQGGTYIATAQIGSCEASDTIIINELPLATFDLGPDLELCEGTMATLDGTSTLAGATYQWEDGSTNPMRSIDTAGTYILTSSLNGCTFQDTVMINLNPVPTVDLGPDQTLCDGQTTLLNAGNPGATFSWSDGSTAATLAVDSAGTYAVTVTLGTCTDTDTITINYNPVPVFELGQDQDICEGSSATLDGTSTLAGVNYTWEDGSTSPVRMVSITGAYVLEASLNGCFFADTVNVNVNPLPIVDLGLAPNLCEGDTFQLDAVNPGASYEWNDGSTNRTLNVTTAGTYSVQVNANNCIGRDTINLTFAPLPIFDLGMDQTSCAGDSIVLDGTSALAGTGYQWSDDGGNINPIRTIRTSGTYILRARAGTCLFEDEVTVTLIDLGEVDLGADQTICEGSSTTLTTNTTASGFVWQDGSTNQSLTVNTAGTYWIEVTEGICSARDSVEIMVNPVPQVNLGPDQTLCVGETAVLDAGPNADVYFWQNGSTNQTLTVNNSGTYSVEIEQNGCTASDEVQVIFDTPFPLNLGPDISQCSDLSLSLRVPSGVNGSWVWSDGSTGSTLPITEAGTYWLELNEACTIRDTIEVELVECVRFRYYSPNGFSPNNDGINDEFKIFFPDGVVITEFTMQVFDRWGGMLFSTQDTEAAWDGKKGDLLVPTGAYIWRMQLTYEDDFRTKTINEGGEIMILR
ncbi:MAG: hypothetical protein Sapg2KO_43740 [Saprospiraceae bacterium]